MCLRTSVADIAFPHQLWNGTGHLLGAGRGLLGVGSGEDGPAEQAPTAERLSHSIGIWVARASPLLGSRMLSTPSASLAVTAFSSTGVGSRSS